jgi:hypothetical protein
MENLEKVIREMAREEVNNVLEGALTFRANKKLAQAKQDVRDEKELMNAKHNEKEQLQQQIRINQARRDAADANDDYSNAVRKETAVHDKEAKLKIKNLSKPKDDRVTGGEF